MKKILNRMIAVEMFGVIMLIILTALMIFSFTSCSVQNSLMKPDSNRSAMITFQNEDYYYFGTYADPKQDSAYIEVINNLYLIFLLEENRDTANIRLAAGDWVIW